MTHFSFARSVASVALLAAVLAVNAGVARGQAAPPAASSEPTYMYVSTDATFLREAPNVRGPALTRLEHGARVEVLERLEGDWWRVRAGDPPVEGYVHRLVLSSGPAISTPTDQPPSPTPPEEPSEETPELQEAPKKTPGPGAIGFGGVGLFVPDARESFDAVGITGNPLVVGGGVEVTRLFGQLFVRGAVDWSQETGERTFVDDTGARYPLGIPLDVRMVPIDFTAGWRFEGRPGKRRVFVPYVGGGAGLLLYHESDEFAEDDEIVDDTFASYHVLGGVDIYLQRTLAIRAEFRYRAVPGALGDGGVSAVTGDTSLGGAVAFVGVAFGR
jgi:hypothetical protein